MAITNKRGIFALLDVRERQATGNWSVKSDVWLSPSPFYGSAPDVGYFAGGSLAATVDRIDYSNDTATASPKGPLTAGVRYGAGTGNNSYGYHAGGVSPTVSTVDRIDYSNDTATASPKGPLSSNRQYMGATGNASYGYFGGGLVTSVVDRIDYSNDTATASPKGPLSLARLGLAATGDFNFGYFGGGIFPSPTLTYSTIDRIDYSNDTATASPKGPLSSVRSNLAAVSSTNGLVY